MTRTRTRWLAGVLVLLAVAVTARYIAVTWLGRMPVDAVLPYPTLLLSDFRDAVWLPTGDLLAGYDPYDDPAFLARHPGTQGYSPYTPSHLLYALGMGTLGWNAGTALWSVICGLALAAMGAWAGFATLRHARPDASRTAAVAAAAAGVLLVWVWRPATIALGLGQPSAVWGPAAAVAAAATVTAVGLPHAARVVLTAAAFAKPQTGIQLAIVAAAARQWRALLWGVAVTAVTSLAVAVWIAGPGGVVGWVLGLPGLVAGRHSRYDQRYTTGNPWIDISSTANRLGLPDLAGPLLAVLVLAVGVAAAVVLRFRGHAGLGATAASVTGLLVVPHCGYDVLLLLPVLMLTCVEVWRTPHGPVRTAAIAAIVPLVVSGLLPAQRLPIVPGGLEPALGQAVLLLVAFAVLTAAAVLARRTVPAEPVGSSR